jgi:protein TonB
MQNQHIPGFSSQPRLLTIALVAAVHIAATYALIMALNPGFTLQPHPDTTIEVIPPQAPPRSRPAADIPVKLFMPGVPNPLPPRPQIDTTTATDTAIPLPQAGAGSTQPIGHSVAPTLTPVGAIPGTHTTPNYPPQAARLNEQGSVRLSLRIDERGYVTDASVVTSSGYGTLDAAAVAWVKDHWRFAPALRDGTPVPASTDAVVTFRLMNRG